MSELPPGQRIEPWERFGLPWFAAARPSVPRCPMVDVTGKVDHPEQIRLSELLSLGRSQIEAGLHCVTTWSVAGISWSGVLFTAVHQALLSRVQPQQDVKWVSFEGADGYRSCMRLTDALGEKVLLADTCEGEPLSAAAGAPLRLIVPGHYGYMWVRAVRAIEYRARCEPGSAGWLAHRRGRVEFEERSPLVPGWMWRRVWRAVLPRVRRKYR